MDGCAEDSADSEGDYSEDDFDSYYHPGGDYIDTEDGQTSADSADPELFPVECLTIEQVENLLNEAVNAVCHSLNTSPSLAKLFLLIHSWDVQKVISGYKADVSSFLATSRVITAGCNCALAQPSLLHNHLAPAAADTVNEDSFVCPVCTCAAPGKSALSLKCQHVFCVDCWTAYVQVKISEGLSTDITCMAQNCDLLVHEEVALQLPISNYHKLQYQHFSFHNYVMSHPQLRYCVGPNCSLVFKAPEALAKRVVCRQCTSVFCFKCGNSYHAPTDCGTIKNWLTKCADDSETANYFSAHTKDCPNCNICIEKNGGCNHMQCYKCKHDFCWMCLGDWKGHGTEYYECSRYKENSETANESAKARAALRKYLHYYERWQNHAKSLKLEEKTLEKIKERINQKVMNGSGTWIDWQYLLDAAALLAKCRYTLQYTYPYAYYMNQESKNLFEYQQAQLEAEIENLSWKIERAETTDRGDLENQMYIAEKRRKTLLKDFFQT
ncbi:hypothetical protein V9T40_011085 [Parthenolecanium corni]|uniref:RBR-type E3 ubiquitin transferase n=1 Tax=Parthenolecanium corni TaxID=536013 RepID=A0AAN9T8A4_9HEMI